MQVEAWQWLNCIFARRLRANYHQLYELGNAQMLVLCLAEGLTAAPRARLLMI